ncbi:bifunctional oligoribonuclease/PAP phosphatase NrnA [Porphyromonas pogonae]|uniref:DHH family phosphoesterase n=1 Tax=Porphyromonas pogonae TaxID=867595 RepID=UPI002E7A58FB|nr:bifunctional oligoribonuclease/PAP phosphatase NrnA [Porphyromonas pogonae]
MDKIYFKPEDLNHFRDLVHNAKSITLLTHTSPDGDTLGCCLGLYGVLGKMALKQEINIISPDELPAYLMWMKDCDKVIVHTQNPERSLAVIQKSDLIICIDFNGIRRVRYEDLTEAININKHPRVMIDHHPEPENQFSIQFSYPELSSTCELLYHILDAMNWQKFVTVDAANAILCGIITDTGCFNYSSESYHTFNVVAELIAGGAQKSFVIDKLYHHNPELRLRLQGYILYRKLDILKEYQTAIITLKQEELKEFGATKDDTEGFVNMPLEIDDINCSCFVREDPDQIKISLRSTGDFPVNEIAKRAFGGGGHKNAAGAEYNGTLEEAKNILIEKLVEIREEYNQSK